MTWKNYKKVFFSLNFKSSETNTTSIFFHKNHNTSLLLLPSLYVTLEIIQPHL